ncbi:Endo-1,4-beta-xylanase D [Pseudocercospora fuligena]|uniref:Beta-xylanase n=1 Tax=Pseudocercospora fuligena TaxID=685502 RepID=A0A8H6RN87_9PEZI|nr:Endo-1,4-beta-xylanase D [Pseudocercospora fuligena]
MYLQSTLLLGTLATSTLASPKPKTTDSGLNLAAKASGKLWFGTAADKPGEEQQDQYYMKELLNYKDFGEVTPANAMKYEFTEPEKGVFNYSEANTFLKAVNPHGPKRKIRCHNLIWHQEIPTWVTNPPTPWTNATLSAVLINHVQTLVEHFGNTCYSWDVVNEAFSDSSSDPAYPYRSIDNPWYQYIGPEYIPMAFKAAADTIKKCNLDVKLYYNDYGIESAGTKATAALNLVKELQSRKIQIDGMGLESHFTAGGTPSQSAQEENMNSFTALGIDVAVTELDVRIELPTNATNLKQQAQDYYSSVAACTNVKRCIGITVWDFDDTYSWVPSTFKGQGSADIWYQKNGTMDTPLIRKDGIYYAVMQALTKRPFSYGS